MSSYYCFDWLRTPRNALYLLSNLLVNSTHHICLGTRSPQKHESETLISQEMSEETLDRGFRQFKMRVVNFKINILKQNNENIQNNNDKKIKKNVHLIRKKTIDRFMFIGL